MPPNAVYLTGHTDRTRQSLNIERPSCSFIRDGDHPLASEMTRAHATSTWKTGAFPTFETAGTNVLLRRSTLTLKSIFYQAEYIDGLLFSNASQNCHTHKYRTVYRSVEQV